MTTGFLLSVQLTTNKHSKIERVMIFPANSSMTLFSRKKSVATVGIKRSLSFSQAEIMFNF